MVMNRIEVFLLVFVQGLSQNLLVSAASCGQSAYSGLVGDIQLPKDRSSYGKNLNCEYDIDVPSNHWVKLTWSSFDVKGSMPSCSSADYVEIFIGCDRTSIGKYCSENTNTELPHEMFSADECMRIRFHSDGSNEGTGFKVKYEAFRLSKNLKTFDSCSGVSSKTKSADTIHSPNWPLGYPTKKDCYWKITVGDNHGIKIAFMDFEMNYDFGCDNDKVKVKGGQKYENYDRSDTVRSSMCGRKRPFYFTSTKDQIYIRFKSKSSSQSSSIYRGFMVGYVVYKKASSGKTSTTAIIVGCVIAALVVLGCCFFCYYRKKRMQPSRGQAHTQIAYQAAATKQEQQPYPVSGGQNLAPPPAASYGPTPHAVDAGYPYPPPQGGQAQPLPGKESYPPPAYPAAGYPSAPPYPSQPPAQPYPPPPGGEPGYPTSAPPYPGNPGDVPPYPQGPPPPGAPYPTGGLPPGGAAPYPTAPSAPPPP